MRKLLQSKWVNPAFWNHPTPVNLLIIILGPLLFFTFLIYIGTWFIWGVSHLPWPPLP